jgi:hypothetical protein
MKKSRPLKHRPRNSVDGHVSGLGYILKQIPPQPCDVWLWEAWFALMTAIITGSNTELELETAQ